MIDTDKYEGHTEGPWWINHKDGDGATSIWSGTIDEGDMNHVADVDAHDSDLRLIADAPLLLAEVKRLRKHIVDMANKWERPLLLRGFLKELLEGIE